jgi:F0F1-type ATP synthase alpha subunit
MHALIIYDDLSSGLWPTANVAALAPPAGPRSLSGRRVLSAFAFAQRAAKLKETMAGFLTPLPVIETGQ